MAALRAELLAIREAAAELSAQRAEAVEAAAVQEREARERRAGRQDQLDREAEARRRALEEQADAAVRELLEEARAQAEALRADARSATSEQTRKLLTREQDLDALEAKLEANQQRLERENRQLGRRAEHREREAMAAAAEHIAELERRAQRAEEALETERARVERAESRVEELESAGGQRAADLVREVDELKRQLDAARADLASRPAAALRDEYSLVTHQLATAREELEAYHRDEHEWRQRVSERDRLKRSLDASKTEIAEQQEIHKQLKGRIVELRESLGLWKDAAEAEPPDSELVEIDRASAKREVARGGLPSDYRPSLEQLVDDVQVRLAQAGFFYEDLHLRIFVAGLAGARIQILDGISGTGKTSLPRMFAEAVGADCDVIEVQAAWRDRIDLLGNYNAFDRRLYPTEFSRALYAASCPGWSDRIRLIVLDEMNLAQPEHYFADVLSALESEKDRLELLPRGVGSAKHLEDNRYLLITPNVWFVGTANLDETTATIADKTYDRANLLELPVRHPIREVTTDPLDSLRLTRRHLAEQFDAAEKTAEGVAAVRRVIDNDKLRAASRPLRIDFGNRVDRIVKRFVPALCAAGGTEQEALDHVLATKLVRKLGYRYETTQAPFDAFCEALGVVAGDDDSLPTTWAGLERECERFGLKWNW